MQVKPALGTLSLESMFCSEVTFGVNGNCKEGFEVNVTSGPTWSAV